MRRVLGEPPPRIGNYEIREQRAEGAYGRVYEGWALHLGRPVAIKRIRGGAGRERSTASGVREATALGRLSSPNVVTVHDVLEHDGETFIVMEYVGESLAAWQKTPRRYDEIRDAYLAAGDGLAAIHAAGLLHLDFKPANVLRDAEGRVRVADLGLSRSVEELSTASSDGATESSRVPLGTRGYSAPEQLAGRLVDARADQYAYCVAFLEALGAEDSAGKRHPIPRYIEAALLRGRSEDRALRWPSMTRLLTELRRVPWHREPRWWMLGITAIVAVPVTVALVPGGDACPDPTQRLAGRWDPTVRSRVAEAFDVASAPYSKPVLATVTAELDDYAARWVEEMNAACEAVRITPPTASVATRLACLERALDRLDRTTAILGEGGSEVIEHADDVVRELPALDRCRTDPEQHPQQDAATGEVEAEADRARLWLAAGRIDNARTAAEQAAVLAERTDDDGVKAEALFVRALVLDAAGEHERATEDLQAAASLAIAGRRDDLSAEAWRTLAMIALYDRQDALRGAEWLELAEAAVVRLERPPVPTADVLDVRGILEQLRGDDLAAERAHREALAELEGEIDADDPRWAETWTYLAGDRMRRGAFDEAEGLMTRVLELRERRLGPDHPDVAKALLGLALIDRARGHGEDGLDRLTRAQTILEQAFGSSSTRLAPVLTAIAEQELASGRLEDAGATANRAWSIQKAGLPMTHSDRVSGAILLLIDVAIAQGDFERALELLAERRAEAQAREDASTVAAVDNDVAWTLCQLRRYEDARPIYAALRVGTVGDAALKARAAAGLGMVALGTGDPAAAIGHLEQALAEWLALAQHDQDELAEIRWHLAEALADSGGSPERIRDLASAALPSYVEEGTPEELASVMRLKDYGLTNQPTRE